MQSENLNENVVALADEPDAANPPVSSNAVAELAMLASRIEQLVEYCAQLTAENRDLRALTATLQAERDVLHEKNEQFRARIDAMVARLRDLEQPS